MEYQAPTRAHSCPVCGVARSVVPRGKTHDAPYGRRTYSLHACRQCAIEFWEPRQLVPEFYRDEGQPTYSRRHAGQARVKQYHRVFLKRLPGAGGRLLDVGCGEGGFLLEARRHGYDIAGLDLDPISISRARESGLSEAHHARLETFCASAPAVGTQYDCVTIFEVLEHQPEPVEFLGHVNRLVRPGGWISGSVPNRDRVLADLERRRSTADYPPHHFLRFSHEALDNLLRSAGFDEIEILPLHLPLRDVAARLEWMMLDNATTRLKRRTAGIAANAADVSVITRVTTACVWTARRIREAALLPAALAYRAANDGGEKLYFEARSRTLEDVA